MNSDADAFVLHGPRLRPTDAPSTCIQNTDDNVSACKHAYIERRTPDIRIMCMLTHRIMCL